MNQKSSKADELFFVVDEHDQPLAPLPRKLVHGHGVWHRASHVALVNGRGEILCHQRALNKEIDPGMWVAVFGGHLAPNEPYESAARRELQEETGVVADNQVRLDDGEVAQVKWFPFAAVQKAFAANDPQWFAGTHQPQLLEALIDGAV